MKKAESQRIDAFKLWCWKDSWEFLGLQEDQPVNPKEINPEYSLEGLILKLNLQYFGHRMLRVNALEKTVMLGKIKGRRRRWVEGVKWLDGITGSMAMNLHKLQKIVKDREA